MPGIKLASSNETVRVTSLLGVRVIKVGNPTTFIHAAGKYLTFIAPASLITYERYYVSCVKYQTHRTVTARRGDVEK